MTGTAVRTEADARPLPALLQRLRAAAGALALSEVGAAGQPEAAVSRLYGALVRRVHADQGPETLWLLLTAMAGAMPETEDVLEAARMRDLTSAAEFGRWLLEPAFQLAADRGAPELEMDVVSDGVVVDVHLSAQQSLHTGIQRVVRETVPRWHAEHEITLVAWSEPGGAMRRLAPREDDRVLRWHDTARSETTSGAARVAAPSGSPVTRQRIVVPWRCSVVLLETPPPEHGPALAALARFSGNRLSLVGYDCIPLISPELIHPGLADRFMRFLETVKYAHRLAGISGTASREFSGFTDMLVAQGLPGPEVVSCPLPVEVPAGTTASPEDPPLVVSIGSFEPRKNQLTVLHAAERLWREGLRFSLEFIGGGGYATELDPLITRLLAAGRPIRRRMAISDDELWHRLRSARFTVFLSLHEGFGLPVAESLACGTPCLTSEYGSTREIADEGGALVVDPLDDDAVTDRVRRLLTDDDLLRDLRRAAGRRPARTWDDYATELWEALVTAGATTSSGAR